MRSRLFWALVLLLAGTAGASAQSLSIDLGSQGASTTARIIQLAVTVTALSLAPSVLVMATAFTRIIIVLSLLRGALGLQGSPPNIVLIGLALFLSFHVMEPVLDQSWTAGLQPLSEGRIDTEEGLRLAAQPFHAFMVANARESDVQLFADLAQLPESESGPAWRALVPGFVISEMRRSFEIGFLIYVPFLVIDLVIASILMSMGMMMLPPNVVSLPFKLIFFVLVDGWRLVAGSLVQSFVGGG